MTEPALISVNGLLKGRMVYAMATLVLATILMSTFHSGRKSLLRIVWLLDSLAGGAPHTVTIPGPPGLPLIGSLFEVNPCVLHTRGLEANSRGQLKDGHVQKISEWTKKYGDVIRVSLGEREAVCGLADILRRIQRRGHSASQVFINSHEALQRQ